MPIGGPELELGVAVRREPHLEQVTGFHDLHVADHLRVAAVEALGQAHDRAEQPDRLPLARGQLAEPLVALLGLRLPMIPGGEGDDLDLVGIEAAQVPVFDQVVRVFVVPLVADVVADVVEQRAVFEPLALACAGVVQALGRVENRERQARDLLGVGGPIATALGQLHHAPAPRVRIALDRADV